MSFIADKQTLVDLSLTGKYRQDSVFSFFNKAHTKGGEQLMEAMFQYPLIDHELINERSSLFAYFHQKQLDFPLDNGIFEAAKNYMDAGVAPNLFVAGAGNIVKKLQAQLIKDQRYELMKTGFKATLITLKTFKNFFRKLDAKGNSFSRQISQVNKLFDTEKWNWLDQDIDPDKLSIFKLNGYDHFLRFEMKEEIQSLIDIIYELDVCIAVARVAGDNDFSYPKAFPKKDNVFKVEALKHPLLKKAVGNDLSLDRYSNVIFLTGANMAGKSTLMKTIGIAFYLAHMGFPVAAKYMEFSVKEGVSTSINTPDDLKMGYSHFYAEVMRVKNIAEKVAAGQDMMVIFDELFKGTNVKDAYEATLAVTEAFATYNNCFFIISTHIIEVGEALRKKCDNLQFKRLPTILENNIPQYTYKLNEGITSDRQGMMIIENEGILELLIPADQIKPN